MHPFSLAGAVGLALARSSAAASSAHGSLLGVALAVAPRAVVGFGVVQLAEPREADRGRRRRRSGTWTYLLVGALAFLETGAFVGLIAPGETAVLVGGVVAGQGQISTRGR